MASNEKTSKPVASQAGKLLPDSKTPKRTRAPIASALAQAPDKTARPTRKPDPRWFQYLKEHESKKGV